MHFDTLVQFDDGQMRAEGTNPSELIRFVRLLEAKANGNDAAVVGVDPDSGQKMTVADIRSIRIEATF